MKKKLPEEMSKSEMSIRKILKNLGVKMHKLIDEKLKSKLTNGSMVHSKEYVINLEMKIDELNLSHTISSKIITPTKDD